MGARGGLAPRASLQNPPGQRHRPGLDQFDPHQIAAEVMDERLQRLQAALGRTQYAFNQASVGRTCEVLVERRGKLEGQWLGKSPWLQSVHFHGDFAIGDLVRVELIQAGPVSLAGRVLK